VWDSNYQGIWHLANGTTLSASDSTSSGNNGTVQGTVTAVTGEIDGAGGFDGSSGYISTTNSFNWPFNLTTEAWVNTTSTAGHKVTGLENIQTGTWAGSYDENLYVDTNGKAVTTCYASGVTQTVVSGSAVNDGNWHHLAATLNTSTNTMTLYVDGVSQGTGDCTGADGFTGYLRIGSYRLYGMPNANDGYFSGKIDEVRFSNSVRSADWIATEYNNESNPSAFYGVGSGPSTPTITSRSPITGGIGTSVTITGTNFGASQGSSTVTFNGTAGTPTSWSATGIVVPVPTGATTGNVVVTVGGVASSGVNFTVSAPSLSTIAVTPANPSVPPGGEQQFVATGTYSDNSTQDLTGTATWSSSTPNVATVGATGLASTLAQGSTTIQASLGSVSGSTALTVSVGFVSVGNMNSARADQTSTLLNNGTVLIAGGSSLSSAELYTPSTQSFTVTGSMETARSSHTATLLANGFVLVAGGPDNTAELYNPSNGSFTPTGNMTSTRSSHTATLLNNGLVLIVGGYDENSLALASAELYDPATGTFTATGNLVTGRASHTATLLNNGQVLITGGYDINGNVLASAELYNPVSQTFAATGNMNNVRVGHTATLLNGGTVLIAGGVDNSFDTFATAELYDSTSGTFTLTGSLNTARVYQTATLLNNGTVLVAGGTAGTGGVFNSAELYDPQAGTFTVTGNLNNAREQHKATLLEDGAVLVTGGFHQAGRFLTPQVNAELYYPATLTPPGLVSIVVSSLSPSIPVGAAQIFTATGTFSGNSTQSLASVTWSSSDSTIATVTSDASDPGQAYGVATGSATVSACAGPVCGSTALAVLVSQITITDLSQVYGAAGTPVIIAGTGFGVAQGSSSVAFNGSAASVSLWSDGGILVTVPEAASTGNVVVTVGGVSSNGIPFTVVASPVINSLSVVSGLAGTPVTISGSNFGSSQGTSTVTFNGTPAPVSTWTNGTIAVTAPSGISSGDVIVSVGGVPSNGVTFSVPNITEILPQDGPIGALITILGGGFGVTQGSGSVTIGGTPMVVVSWSDTEIEAAVAAGTTTGVLSVQQGSSTLSGGTFTVNSIFPYNVSPQSISLLVGQTRTISVTDSAGSPVSGLQWITTNSNVVSLSTDDPPVITALAPGSAIVYAGEAPISVTVYAGTSLPAGTINWSVPVGGGSSANPSLVPAVPSASGADLFVLSATGLSVLSSDGTLLSTDGNLGYSLIGNGGAQYMIGASLIPDFTGNAVLKSWDTYNYTHQVSQVNVATGQQTPLYTFSLQPYDFGNIQSDFQATQTVIPDTTGKVFVQDNDKVLVLDPSTGATIGSVTMENSAYIFDDAPDFFPSQTFMATFGKMIVAGDGNAYVPYIYVNLNASEVTTTDTPTLIVGTYIYQATSKLMLLRVSPDGTFAKTELNEATFDQTTTVTTTNPEQSNETIQTVCSGNGSVFDGPVYADALGGPAQAPPGGGAPIMTAITNGGTGAAVVAYVPFAVACQNQMQSQHQIDFVSQDSLTSQVDLDPGLSSDFTPALQREDGSYVGTDQSGIVAVGTGGGIIWSQQLVSTPTPLYATSDGGVIVTSTPAVCPGGDLAYDQHLNLVCQDNLGLPSTSGPNPLGTLYTLDQNGNVTSSTPDPGAVYSWKGSYVTAGDPAVQSATLPIPYFAPTYGAVLGGNLTAVSSRSGAAVVHHSIGIFWCGDTLSGSCQGQYIGAQPAQDLGFTYAPYNQFPTPNLIDFTTAQPAWVDQIMLKGMNAVKAAFAQYPVLVEPASSTTTYCQNQSWFGCIFWPKQTTTPAQDLLVYVTGNYSPTAGGITFFNEPPSYIYYQTLMENAQLAVGSYVNGGWAALSPQYSQSLTPQQASQFWSIVTAAGVAIGNTAAHEIGHQLQLPGMDCGLPANYDNQGNAAGPSCPVGVTPDLFYEYWEGINGWPPYVAPGGAGDHYLDVGPPLQWTSQDASTLFKLLLK
jgi:hypothetical protein